MHIFYPKTGCNDQGHAKVEVDPASETLESLRSHVSKLSDLESFHILFRGRVLSGDKKPLSNFKISSESTVHVLKKAVEPVNEPAKVMSDAELQQFLIAFGMAIRNPDFHKVALRMGQRENLENIAVTCPSLAKDPVACAFLSKPELLYSILDPEALKYISKVHPGLCEAIHHLAAAVHEERLSTASTSAITTSASSGQQDETALPAPPFAYNLDEMTDEEVDDDDDELDYEGGRRPAQPPITADQLASALAAARSVMGGGGSTLSLGGMTGMTPASRPPGQSPSTSGGITQDQLAAALAMAVGGSGMSSAAGTNASMSMDQSPVTGMDTTSGQESNYENQLATMREMGISNMGLATRALQVMGGDLQAAIDLIYSGWLGEDSSAN